MNVDQRIIEKIVRKVGTYLADNYGKAIKQHLIDGTHYDTIHDKIASDIYQKDLAKYYPDIQFYSEEFKDHIDATKPYWIIDPIEGTTNFARNIPFFATQIAYVESNIVICSAVYLPILQELYTATRGKGAYCNGVKISVGSVANLNQAVVNVGKGTGVDNLTWWGNTMSHLAPLTRTNRLYGSTGIDICYVASGKLDLHINHGSHNYDYAPGSLIAEEAGASVTNFSGKNWQLTDSDIVISNTKLVKELFTRCIPLITK
ncbi:MAG: inositol monophosphatase [Candidatus Moraniibacteriota bacterium]|nr:MAG: inositol monophosphatase [Candidatus Moranbacteria bacterium]